MGSQLSGHILCPGEASLGGSPSSISWTPQHLWKATSLQAWVPRLWEAGGGLASAPCLSLGPALDLFVPTVSLLHILLFSPLPTLPHFCQLHTQPTRAPGSVSTGADVNQVPGPASTASHQVSLALPMLLLMPSISLWWFLFLSQCLLALPSVSLLKAQNNRQLYVHKKMH